MPGLKSVSIELARRKVRDRRDASVDREMRRASYAEVQHTPLAIPEQIESRIIESRISGLIILPQLLILCFLGTGPAGPSKGVDGIDTADETQSMPKFMLGCVAKAYFLSPRYSRIRTDMILGLRHRFVPELETFWLSCCSPPMPFRLTAYHVQAYPCFWIGK